MSNSLMLFITALCHWKFCRAISPATMTVIGLEMLATGSELRERSFA